MVGCGEADLLALPSGAMREPTYAGEAVESVHARLVREMRIQGRLLNVTAGGQRELGGGLERVGVGGDLSWHWSHLWSKAKGFNM